MFQLNYIFYKISTNIIIFIQKNIIFYIDIYGSKKISKNLFVYFQKVLQVVFLTIIFE